MLRKKAAVFGVVLGLAVLLVLPVMANILTGAGATADCTGFNLTVNAVDLSPGTSYGDQLRIYPYLQRIDHHGARQYQLHRH
jgi:hypothetical protein